MVLWPDVVVVVVSTLEDNRRGLFLRPVIGWLAYPIRYPVFVLCKETAVDKQLKFNV